MEERHKKAIIFSPASNVVLVSGKIAKFYSRGFFNIDKIGGQIGSAHTSDS